MRLQTILFPKEGICSKKELYFRCNGKTAFFDPKKRRILFKQSGECRFDTYYGMISANKWEKYCFISNLTLNLTLQGDFALTVYRKIFTGKSKKDKNLDKLIVTQKVSYHLIQNPTRKTVKIPLPAKCKGSYWFKLECFSAEGVMYGGFYSCDKPKEINDVQMAGVVCTFRREEYVARNMQMLRKDILENKKSQAYGHIKVFISDNSVSLPEEVAGPDIFVYPNLNAGGAGGFTRGLIEVMNYKKEHYVSHIVMMDDDILFDTEIFERVYAMLALLRPAHKNAFISGAMFRMDNMHIQQEMADRWEWKAGKNTPIMFRKDMTVANNLIINDLPDPINYSSWWFCVMPGDIPTEYNLPLPIFIKRDDIEYGLRNGHEFITLNGINVWHEPFEQKRPAYLEYYYIRNQLIMEAMYQNYSAKRLKDKLKAALYKDIFTFRYIEANLRAKGVEDYLKGIDWLKEQNPVEINDMARAMDRKSAPLVDLKYKFNAKKYAAAAAYKEPKQMSFKRKITFNGWLLRPNKHCGVSTAAFPKPGNFYRRRVMINIEPVSQTGFYTFRTWRKALKLIWRYHKLNKEIDRKFAAVNKEYKNRYHELIRLDYWKDYLNLDSNGVFHPENEYVPAKSFPNEAPATSTSLLKKARLQLNVDYYYDARLKEPIDEKAVYIESRKCTDLASNMLHILIEMRKPEYADFKVYVGYEPSAKAAIVSKIEQYNIKNTILVLKDSHDYYKALATAKYFYTDFHLSHRFAKREGQIVVSTWHGTPLKTLGKDCKTETQASVQRICLLSDYQVYPGEFMLEKMVDVYWQRNISKGKMLCTGYPRNEAFFDDVRRAEIRKELGIEDKQVIMYMPTFRGIAGDNHNASQNEDLLSYFRIIDKELRDDQLFYLKLHNYNSAAIDCSEFKHIQKAPVQYDVYELMNACDMLITDYSSCFFDYACCRRKIILFQYDYEEYLRERGVCIDNDALPFPKIFKAEDLVAEINRPKDYDDTAFLAKYATYDNGRASELLLRYVMLGDKDCVDPSLIKDIPDNGKPNILIYNGPLNIPHHDSLFWHRMQRLDYEKANYFLVYYEPIMWKHADRLYEAPDALNMLGIWSYTAYTTKEMRARDKFFGKEHDRSEETISTLKNLYQRELLKLFGNNIRIDGVVMAWPHEDRVDAMFACAPGKKVILFPGGKPSNNPNINYMIKQGDFKVVAEGAMVGYLDNADWEIAPKVEESTEEPIQEPVEEQGE